MTVKSIPETQDRVIADLGIQQKHINKELSLPVVKEFMEGEMDRESGDASNCKNSNKIGFVHSQVLRIREEDSHLGEDKKEKVMNVGGFNQNMQQLRRVASAVDVVFLSRPILPSSPLSRKTTVQPLPYILD